MSVIEPVPQYDTRDFIFEQLSNPWFCPSITLASSLQNLMKTILLAANHWWNRCFVCSSELCPLMRSGQSFQLNQIQRKV